MFLVLWVCLIVRLCVSLLVMCLLPRFHSGNSHKGWRIVQYVLVLGLLYHGCLLGLPVGPFYPFLGAGEGSPSKIDYRKKDTLIILTSLLEDLVSPSRCDGLCCQPLAENQGSVPFFSPTTKQTRSGACEAV